MNIYAPNQPIKPTLKSSAAYWKRSDHEDMKELIVQTDIMCITDTGERHRMTVEIGEPYPVGDEYACHVALRGLHDHLSPIVGGDQMQSLVLAVSFIRSLLKVLVDKGHKIVFPDDPAEDISVMEIWFSSLGNTGDPNQQVEHISNSADAV